MRPLLRSANHRPNDVQASSGRYWGLQNRRQQCQPQQLAALPLRHEKISHNVEGHQQEEPQAKVFLVQDEHPQEPPKCKHQIARQCNTMLRDSHSNTAANHLASSRTLQTTFSRQRKRDQRDQQLEREPVCRRSACSAKAAKHRRDKLDQQRPHRPVAQSHCYQETL